MTKCVEMMDFIILMHGDALCEPADVMWGSYFESLSEQGVFEGGSSIGAGSAFRKQGVPAPESAHFTGFIRVKAATMEDAVKLLNGNPVYESGGTVEVRELPRD